MQMLITGRGVVLTPAFTTLVERKLGRLARILPPIARARVACDGEKLRRTVRLTLAGRRRTFSSQATARDLLTAVDDAIEALRRQVREDKDRRRSRGARGAGATRARPAPDADA